MNFRVHFCGGRERGGEERRPNPAPRPAPRPMPRRRPPPPPQRRWGGGRRWDRPQPWGPPHHKRRFPNRPNVGGTYIAVVLMCVYSGQCVQMVSVIFFRLSKGLSRLQ